MTRTEGVWHTISLPRECRRFPSMLTDEERQYLLWLTKETYSGWGAIVDLGPWLGSSSCALAEGLKQAGSRAKVHSLDRFVWCRDYMESYLPADLPEGSDFLPLFIRETATWKRWIEPRKIDLLDFVWSEGPIEILFVDAAKDWQLLNAIFAGFGGSLVPGRSRVVLQDFRLPEAHWLPLVFDSRPDVWRQIEAVDDGTTVTFMPVKPVLGEIGVHPSYSDSGFPAASAEVLLRARVSNEKTARNRSLILRTLYRKLLIEGALPAAERVLADVVATTDSMIDAEELTAIGDIAATLVPAGWKRFAAGDISGARKLAERCLANGPRSVYALDLLAYTALKGGDIDLAEQAAGETVAANPSYPDFVLHLAEVRLFQKRFDEALSGALQALKLSEGDDRAITYSLSVLEQAAFASGKVELVLNRLIDLQASLATHSSYWVTVAKGQRALGTRAAALQSLETALQLDPDHDVAASLFKAWSS